MRRPPRTRPRTRTNASIAARRAPATRDQGPPPTAGGQDQRVFGAYHGNGYAAQGAPAPSVADQGVAGHSVIFFIRPQQDGADIPSQGRRTADDFCRDQNLGPALYYDSDARILRDVVCRRD